MGKDLLQKKSFLFCLHYFLIFTVSNSFHLVKHYPFPAIFFRIAKTSETGNILSHWFLILSVHS